MLPSVLIFLVAVPALVLPVAAAASPAGCGPEAATVARIERTGQRRWNVRFPGRTLVAVLGEPVERALHEGIECWTRVVVADAKGGHGSDDLENLGGSCIAEWELVAASRDGESVCLAFQPPQRALSGTVSVEDDSVRTYLREATPPAHEWPTLLTVERRGLFFTVLGFSVDGKVALVETDLGGETPGGPRPGRLRVFDLVTDRVLADAPRDASATNVLRTHRIVPTSGLMLNRHSGPGGEISTSDLGHYRARIEDDRVLLEQELRGPKTVGALGKAARATAVLGWARSPFEDRLAILVGVEDGSGRLELRVLGGHLSAGWPRAGVPKPR